MKNSKIKTIMKVVAALFILAGLSSLLFPPVSREYHAREAEKVIKAYQKRIESAEPDGLEQLYRLIVQYNEELYENRQRDLIDPFSYEEGDFSLTRFGFDEDMLGYLSIPPLDIRLPVYLGANRDNMKKGAAQLTQTSIPVGGVNTNAVIAAHRGFGTAAMFRDIQKLKIGDDITLTNFRETLVYRVAEIKIIHPAAINEILIREGRDMVTLITCHPYRKNYQRYVVYCERVLEQQ